MPKLTEKDAAYLAIEIGGKTYRIPLSRSLKIKEVRKLMKLSKLDDSDQFDFMVEFFGKYLGAEVVDELTTADLIEIIKLWRTANEEVGDLDLGGS